MTTYTLDFRQVGETGSEGAFDLVNVFVDGRYESGRAFALLPLVGEQGSATVFLPLGVMLDGNLSNEYADHHRFTHDSGTRHYCFADRDAALTFLRRIYGIDAPQPDPEPEPELVEEECWLCDGCGEVETFKADGSPITVGCPACVQRDRDAIIARLYQKIARLTYPDMPFHQAVLIEAVEPVDAPEPQATVPAADTTPEARQPADSPRSIPAPLARDVAAPSAFPLAGRQIGPLFHLFWGTSSDATPTIRRNTQ